MRTIYDYKIVIIFAIPRRRSTSLFPSKTDDNAADQVAELTAGGVTSSPYVAPLRCPSSPLPDAPFPIAHFPNVPFTKAPFPDAPLPDLPLRLMIREEVNSLHLILPRFGIRCRILVVIQLC